jgi:cell shape-determining protein MreC
MPKFVARPSNSLQSSWERWGTYAILLLVSIFLLIAEQSGAFSFLWDAADLTAKPGIATTRYLQSTHTSVLDQIFWRQRVVTRLSQVEAERLQQDLAVAQLTLQIEMLSARADAAQASISGSVNPEMWQPSVWQGIPGAWQIQSGCVAGVNPGDPVITPEGVLVGNIRSVYQTYSTVTSWDSPDWRTPVRVGTASAIALAESTVTAPALSRLRWPSPVAIGDSIFTAGSGTTPRNLFVGSVQALQPAPVFGEVSGEIRVPVDLQRVQNVFVPSGRGETCSQE